MSYPEFMQRRSTQPNKAIIEEVDYTTLSNQQQQQFPAARNQGPMEDMTAATAEDDVQQQQTTKTLRCIKDIWQAAIEGDVECLEANLSLGASLAQLGQPILSSSTTTTTSQNTINSNNSSQQQLWGPLFDRCALFRATPLQYACAYNRIEAAKFLLDRGASWEQLSSTGVSAKDYARRRNYLEILKLIEEKEHERRQQQQQQQAAQN